MALAMVVVLQGCVSNSDRYPSLAIRDVERQFDSPTIGNVGLEVPEQPITVPPSPALAARLDRIRAQALASHRKFMNEVPTARRAIRAGRGASQGSDSWSSAKVALASLESARSVTAESLGDIDQLYGRTVEESGAIAAVHVVRAEIEALISEEDTILYRLGR